MRRSKSRGSYFRDDGQEWHCKLPVAGLADGDYVLVITPDSKQDAAPLVPKGSPLVRKQPSPARLVAPDDVEFAYRGTRVAISIQGERLKTHPRIAVAEHKHARVEGRDAHVSRDRPQARLGARQRCEETQGSARSGRDSSHWWNNMPGDLATFTSSNKSIHYLMDLDGHIIKMVNDGDNWFMRDVAAGPARTTSTAVRSVSRSSTVVHDGVHPSKRTRSSSSSTRSRRRSRWRAITSSATKTSAPATTTSRPRRCR